MRGELSDQELRAALLEAAARDFAELLSQDLPAPRWSARYLRRRRALLADPSGWAKRAARPGWQRALRTAAIVLLTVSVSLGTVAVTAPEAWAKMQQLLVQVFADHDRIQFEAGGDQRSDLDSWAPEWLPEGFELAEERNRAKSRDLIFENEEGVRITLSLFSAQQTTTISIDNEHSTQEPATVNGREAHLRRGNTAEDWSFLLWEDERANVAFLLSGRWNAEDLIRIAESVVQGS